MDNEDFTLEDKTDLLLLRARGIELFGDPRRRLNSWNNENPIFEEVKKTCSECGESFSVPQSHKEYVRCDKCREQIREKFSQQKRKMFICQNCGREFKDKYGKAKRTGCNKRCAAEWKSRERREAFERRIVA